MIMFTHCALMTKLTKMKPVPLISVTPVLLLLSHALLHLPHLVRQSGLLGGKFPRSELGLRLQAKIAITIAHGPMKGNEQPKHQHTTHTTTKTTTITKTKTKTKNQTPQLTKPQPKPKTSHQHVPGHPSALAQTALLSVHFKPTAQIDIISTVTMNQ